MAKTTAHMRAVCDLIAGQGALIKLHSADPGTTGASVIATTPASGTTTWGAAADGTDGDAGKAVATGSAVALTMPASTTATHFSVSTGGGTFLRGAALDAPITTGAGTVSVDVTPKTKFS